MDVFSESKTEKGNEGGSKKHLEKCEATMERQREKCEVEYLYNDQVNEETCDGRGSRVQAMCVTEHVNCGVGKNVKKQGEIRNNPLNSKHSMLGEEDGGKEYAMESVGVVEKDEEINVITVNVHDGGKQKNDAKLKAAVYKGVVKCGIEHLSGEKESADIYASEEPH